MHEETLLAIRLSSCPVLFSQKLYVILRSYTETHKMVSIHAAIPCLITEISDRILIQRKRETLHVDMKKLQLLSAAKIVLRTMFYLTSSRLSKFQRSEGSNIYSWKENIKIHCYKAITRRIRMQVKSFLVCSCGIFNRLLPHRNMLYCKQFYMPYMLVLYV